MASPQVPHSGVCWTGEPVILDLLGLVEVFEGNVHWEAIDMHTLRNRNDDLRCGNMKCGSRKRAAYSLDVVPSALRSIGVILDDALWSRLRPGSHNHMFKTLNVRTLSHIFMFKTSYHEAWYMHCESGMHRLWKRWKVSRRWIMVFTLDACSDCNFQ